MNSHDQVEYEQAFKGNFHMSNWVDDLAASILRNQVYGLREMQDFAPTVATGVSEDIASMERTSPSTLITPMSNAMVDDTNGHGRPSM